MPIWCEGHVRATFRCPICAADYQKRRRKA